ncbi:MAG TPA: lytic transglycosylase [Cytophagales bacterium]|nr:lytic transglycosylase [Cytophagales bacterium]
MKQKKHPFLALLGLGMLLSPWAFSQTEDSDTLRQPYDFVPEVQYDSVEARLASMEGEVPLTFNNRVFGFVDYFVIRNRDYTRGFLELTPKYFPLFEQKLKEHGLPEELKFLAIVESGLVPRAQSRVGAMGLWQFMPSTGRYFGLYQDWFIDDRMDPEKATEAACLYLKQLYRIFGDWELAIASYNAGPGNVRKALRRSGKSTFWEAYRYMPRETRGYLPQFVAVMYAYHYAPEHNLIPTEPQFAWDTESFTADHFVNLPTVARHLNLCTDDLEALNPGLKHGVTADYLKLQTIHLPADAMPLFLEHKDSILYLAKTENRERMEYLARNTLGSTYGREKLVYRVKSGDVLGRIAENYGVRTGDLRQWNGIRGSTIYVGQRLNIWVLPNQRVPARQTAVAQTHRTPSRPVPEGAAVHVVQSGDSLWSISQQYDGLSIAKIKELNGLSSDRIQPGQQLVINVPKS